MCIKAQDQVPVCTDHPALQTEWDSQCCFDGIVKNEMEIYESHFKKIKDVSSLSILSYILCTLVSQLLMTRKQYPISLSHYLG